jgi:1-acyl-sn-glycerol-3-phosphate acyltransferase
VSDLFYSSVRALGRPVFWITSRPLVLHPERLESLRSGTWIVAANHQSPYDIPLLMRHCPRHLDFISITEVFRNPFLGWFYGSMNAFPLDRARPDAKTVRSILDRLERGRAVAMFPEGRITPLDDSVVRGGRLRPGIGRIAQLGGARILPIAIVNSLAYQRPASWLPGRRVRYGIHPGEPLAPRPELPADEAANQLEEDLRASLIRLHGELSAAIATHPDQTVPES